MLSERNSDAGVSCTYYDYTSCKGVPNVVLKISRSGKELLIMTRNVAARRLKGKSGCFSFLQRDGGKAIAPKSSPSMKRN